MKTRMSAFWTIRAYGPKGQLFYYKGFVDREPKWVPVVYRHQERLCARPFVENPARFAAALKRVSGKKNEFTAVVAVYWKRMLHEYDFKWFLKHYPKNPKVSENKPSPCCAASWHWKQVAGIRVFNVVKGRKVLSARCGKCRTRYDIDGGKVE